MQEQKNYSGFERELETLGGEGIATKEPPSVGRVTFAAAVGATVEWYDFFLYGLVAALVFNRQFFPSDDPLVGTMLAYGTFAAGFVARPIGGILFGHFGDRVGRKSMLILTLMIMGVATVIIGLLPNYAQIGIWAPILLLLMRVLQGLGIGGEWGGAVLMAVEYAPPGKRGFYGSLTQVGLSVGLVLASGVMALFSLLPEEQFQSWGWRVPFLLSAVLIAVGMYIRLNIMETPAFAKVKENRAEIRIPFFELIRDYPKSILLGMGARYIDGVIFNIYAVFIVSYLTTSMNVPRITVLTGIMIAAIVMVFAIPLFGRLSDVYGRRPIYGIGSLINGALVCVSFWMMTTGQSTGWLWLAIIIPFGIAYAAVYGPEAALFAELFDTRVRYSGISFVYQFSGIFASGLTPIIATYLLAVGGGEPWWVVAYAVLVSVISAACVFAMRETAHHHEVFNQAGEADDPRLRPATGG